MEDEGKNGWRGFVEDAQLKSFDVESVDGTPTKCARIRYQCARPIANGR